MDVSYFNSWGWWFNDIFGSVAGVGVMGRHGILYIWFTYEICMDKVNWLYRFCSYLACSMKF